jgi:hypothetical protein
MNYFVVQYVLLFYGTITVVFAAKAYQMSRIQENTRWRMGWRNRVRSTFCFVK